ncbi:MAG: HAMP domain-containing protein, partial [Candidatus Thioglobus sp.]|nr:HAMP domain-containing protein [Candidatus Thioglobus sp.]
MVFNQDLSLKNAPNKWFWSSAFLLSLGGLVYLGLNPELIEDWWWILVTYNILMGLVAGFYIFAAVSKLKKDNRSGIIGTQFTWSFVKIIPLLVIVPVLSFYLFSFQTVRDNVERSESTYKIFNQQFIGKVKDLYGGGQVIQENYYTERTVVLLRQINNYSNEKKYDIDYEQIMQDFVQNLVDNGWACQIILRNEKSELIVKSKRNKNCKKVFKKQMSSANLPENPQLKDFINISIFYPADRNILQFLQQVEDFYNFANSLKFEVNTSLTKKRFLLDFYSTILLTILSVLLIVFRMIDQLMRPMHNLSEATKEIAHGNYDVLVQNQKESSDIRQLIAQFNEMSRQIKSSREGLDTHNLYLETILKYSYGVIGLDKMNNIRLINPVIGKMLLIKNEQQFIGGLYQQIGSKHKYLKPLFDMAAQKFKQNSGEWSKEMELSLPGRHVLLDCQGAVLDVNNETLGYVIIVKDISKLHRAQKKAAWGEVAVRMAHEIKNPLTPILLSAQRLRNKFLKTSKGKDLAIIDKTTTVIIDQVKSMDSMVSAFADYANTPQIERTVVDINSLIHQSIALYDAQKNINIEVERDGKTIKKDINIRP